MCEPIEIQLKQWAENIETLHLPRWNELPELELYMDQVIVFTEKTLCGLMCGKNNFITPAMVNNYVKLGLIPKPLKKKYNRRHLAYLMVITLLKELFPIAEIKVAIQMQTAIEGSGEAAYNLFCGEIEYALAAAAAEMLGKENPPYRPAHPTSRLLRMSARAFACRTAAAQEVVLYKYAENCEKQQ